MSTSLDIGKLLHLPLDEITVIEPIEVSSFIVEATAAALKQDGRNWIPLIVKPIGEYAYEVVANSFIYAVAEAAQLERVWCVIADPNPEVVNLCRYLAQTAFPKINLTTANRDLIYAALQYLLTRKHNPLKSVDLLKATERISQANRKYWQDFKPLTELKCAIGEAKLSVLKDVFYLTPQPLPLPPHINLTTATKAEILEGLTYLIERPTNPLVGVDLDIAVERLVEADRANWQDFKPVPKLGCKLTATKIPLLKEVFFLTPPSKPTPTAKKTQQKSRKTQKN